ncbi:MAG: AAA family ATPase, partial [Clostridia bacterium]|nr:AAA family ATPase [Clostridia bacterium]
QEIAAAKKLGKRHIDNILLFGTRGLGKSTLMKLIAKELGVDFRFMDASAFSNDVGSQRKLHKFFMNICEYGQPVVIAFDEIHAMPKHIQTALLTLLNDRIYSYMDNNGMTQNIAIKEFTFIGATTDEDKVLPTIKDRCNNLTFYLKDYTREELAKIFNIKFGSYGLSVEDGVMEDCINRCRSSIREVESFVNGLRTKAINADTTVITQAIAEEYFSERELDPIGLRTKDIEILNVLVHDAVGVMAAETLA